jgi:hypothetical protein
MDSTEFRHHSCGRKVPFTTRREARQMASLTSDRYGGGRVEPYRCLFDEAHWHIGHKLGPKERKALRRAS